MADAPFSAHDVALVDSSAWRNVKNTNEAIQAEFQALVLGNKAALSPAIRFELLYWASLRGLQKFTAWLDALGAVRTLVPDKGTWDRALEAYQELAGKGMLTGPSLIDIVLAASASEKVLPILTCDSDYSVLAGLDCLEFEAIVLPIEQG